MYLSAVIGWTLAIAALMAVFICSWLGVFALWPEFVKRGADRYSRPFSLTGAGLVVAAPGSLAGIALAQINHPLFKFVGITVMTAVFLIGVAGSAGLCLRVGRGLASPADKDRPWLPVVRGSVVLAFVCLFPLIGWIGILGWLLISGCGVIVSARFGHSPQAAAAPALPPDLEPAKPEPGLKSPEG
jgi:hypothetical protein